MPIRKHYLPITHSAKQIAKLRKEFFARAGASLQLLADMLENAPGIALVIKDECGRVLHTNRYNAQISGWSSPSDIIGYTSNELYPPDQAAVYSGRDYAVMKSGIPIIERLYGFVADRSTSLNCVTVRPIVGVAGKRVGTATIYWRADCKLGTANWYDPIRRAIVHLNEHYKENIPVSHLAALANYSEPQFRRLFKELTQQTPSQYLMQVRVNAAKTLLTTTDMLITSIAQETGFYDHAHLIRSFRAMTGQTPATFRKQQRR